MAERSFAQFMTSPRPRREPLPRKRDEQLQAEIDRIRAAVARRAQRIQRERAVERGGYD